MTHVARRLSFVRAIAGISGVYDGGVGVFLLLAPGRMATLFGVPPAQPPIFSDLNGLFLLAVGIGYGFPYRDPIGARWYLWVMGPLLKGAGAAAFLLFAASDGVLALLTLAALLGSRASSR